MLKCGLILVFLISLLSSCGTTAIKMIKEKPPAQFLEPSEVVFSFKKGDPNRQLLEYVDSLENALSSCNKDKKLVIEFYGP